MICHKKVTLFCYNELTDDGLVAAVTVEESSFDVHVEDGHLRGLRVGGGGAERVLCSAGHRGCSPCRRPSACRGLGSNLGDQGHKEYQSEDPPRHC